MSTITKTIDRADMICGLKSAVAALECQNNMQLIKRKREKSPGPMCCVDLVEEKPFNVKKCKIEKKCSNGYSNVERAIQKTAEYDKTNVEICDSEEVQAIFPEMRSSILYSKCYCVSRNGLQDTCPLIQCQGQSECLFKPWPVCPPGRLMQHRYPELYPT